MGEVYRARDTRLDRMVALKVIRSGLSADHEFRRRFDREARAISGLTHPNICTLHDVGRHDGADFLVMEYLEGETLARRLQRGRLPLELAIRCAIQIAEALDKAHSSGIVHRDLKPANVMLTGSGAARRSAIETKLLDFGLARLTTPQAPLDDVSVSATATAPHEPATAGALLGTVHYMAPEQLEGRPADARADLFAFGALVYEMITGRRAFDGPTAAAVIGAILHSEPPPLRTLEPKAPSALEYLVSVCLEKDPAARWSSARDVVLLLRALESHRFEGTIASPDQRRARWLPWLIAGAALTLVAALGTRAYLGDERAPAVRHVAISPPSGAIVDLSSAPQVSPDGRRLAFVAVDAAGQSRLYVRALDVVTIQPLPETEGAVQPFWSPDSKSLGFFAGGRLKTIAIEGGRPRNLAAAPVPRGGTWNQHGLILFVPSPPNRVHQVPAAGGEAKQVETLPQNPCWFPAFLPDGRHFLCTPLNAGRRVERVFVASLDSTDIKTAASTSAAGAIVANGHLLYRREGEIVAQRLDQNTFQPTGAPVTIAPDVAVEPLTYQALFSASTDGTVAYIAPRGGSRLVWYDRNGKELATVGARANYNSVCLTADETRIFVDQAEPSGDVDIWMIDAATGSPSRLTFDAAVDFYPLCSPNGREIVFGSLRRGQPGMYHQQTTAPGSEQLLVSLPWALVPLQWTRDGRIVFRALHPNTNWDIWIVPLVGEREPVQAVANPPDERFGRLSDDGKWIAYGSSQTGTFEVYVQPFPGGGATWQVSRGGGVEPQWRADGKELFYLSPNKTLMAVEVTVNGAVPHFGPPRALFSTHAVSWEGTGNQYAVASHGKRFLVNRRPEDAAATPVSLVLNGIPRRRTLRIVR